VTASRYAGDGSSRPTPKQKRFVTNHDPMHPIFRGRASYPLHECIEQVAGTHPSQTISGFSESAKMTIVFMCNANLINSPAEGEPQSRLGTSCGRRKSATFLSSNSQSWQHTLPHTRASVPSMIDLMDTDPSIACPTQVVGAMEKHRCQESRSASGSPSSGPRVKPPPKRARLAPEWGEPKGKPETNP
jgi:hypothetical protein